VPVLVVPPLEYLSAWYSTPFKVVLAVLPESMATTKGSVMPLEELELLEEELELELDELEEELEEEEEVHPGWL
jgi:hypothetical protein